MKKVITLNEFELKHIIKKYVVENIETKLRRRMGELLDIMEAAISDNDPTEYSDMFDFAEIISQITTYNFLDKYPELEEYEDDIDSFVREEVVERILDKGFEFGD